MSFGTLWKLAHLISLRLEELPFDEYGVTHRVAVCDQYGPLNVFVILRVYTCHTQVGVQLVTAL